MGKRNSFLLPIDLLDKYNKPGSESMWFLSPQDSSPVPWQKRISGNGCGSWWWGPGRLHTASTTLPLWYSPCYVLEGRHPQRLSSDVGSVAWQWISWCRRAGLCPTSWMEFVQRLLGWVSFLHIVCLIWHLSPVLGGWGQFEVFIQVWWIRAAEYWCLVGLLIFHMLHQLEICLILTNGNSSCTGGSGSLDDEASESIGANGIIAGESIIFLGVLICRW